MKYSRYPQLTKYPVISTFFAIIGDMDNIYNKPHIGLYCQLCQGSVLHQEEFAAKKRFALLLPIDVYSGRESSIQICKDWCAFLQKINPDLVLDTSFRSIGEILGTQSHNISDHFDYDFCSGYTFYRDQPTLKTPAEFLQRTDFVVIEFPGNSLAGITITLARYLCRHPYTAIPQFVLELYNHYNLTEVQALVLGHFGTLVWYSKEGLIKFMDGFDHLQSVSKNFGGARVGKEIRDLLNIRDYTDAQTYENYYGLMYPHPINWELLSQWSLENLLKMSKSTKQLNQVIHFQDKLYSLKESPLQLSNFGHGHTCGSSLFSHMVSNNRNKEWTANWINKVAIPARELSESGINDPVPVFLDKVKEISKQIYGEN